MTEVGFGSTALALVAGATILVLCALTVESARRTPRARESRTLLIRFLTAMGMSPAVLAAATLSVGATVTYAVLNAFGFSGDLSVLIVLTAAAMLTAAVTPRTMPALGKVHRTISYRHCMIGILAQVILLTLLIVFCCAIRAGQSAGDITPVIASVLLLLVGIATCGASLTLSVGVRWFLIRWAARTRLRKSRHNQTSGIRARGRRALRY